MVSMSLKTPLGPILLPSVRGYGRDASHAEGPHDHENATKDQTNYHVAKASANTSWPKTLVCHTPASHVSLKAKWVFPRILLYVSPATSDRPPSSGSTSRPAMISAQLPLPNKRNWKKSPVLRQPEKTNDHKAPCAQTLKRH